VAADEFWINDVSLGGDGKFHLQCTARATNYYILYRGETVTNLDLPTVLVLGQDGMAQLTDPALAVTNRAAFFRVRAVPLNQALDCDGDGLDDVAELGRGTNPLNGDSDGDGWEDGVEVAGRAIPEGTNAIIQIELPVGAPTNQTVTVQARGFTNNVPVAVTITPENQSSIRYDTLIIPMTSDPSSLTLDVVIPDGTISRIHAWTR
jgi:hypothetical protein